MSRRRDWAQRGGGHSSPRRSAHQAGTGATSASRWGGRQGPANCWEILSLRGKTGIFLSSRLLAFVVFGGHPQEGPGPPATETMCWVACESSHLVSHGSGGYEPDIKVWAGPPSLQRLWGTLLTYCIFWGLQATSSIPANPCVSASTLKTSVTGFERDPAPSSMTSS